MVYLPGLPREHNYLMGFQVLHRVSTSACPFSEPFKPFSTTVCYSTLTFLPNLALSVAFSMLASSEFKPSPGVFAKGLDVISQKNVTKMIISILSNFMSWPSCPSTLRIQFHVHLSWSKLASRPATEAISKEFLGGLSSGDKNASFFVPGGQKEGDVGVCQTDHHGD